MDGLQGSFRTMPMADLVRYLADRKVSGTLRCEQGTSTKSFVLEEGACTQCSSNDPREYLGQFLINLGHINEEQLTQAFETQKETRVYLGRILVMIGLVDEPVIQQVLQMKIRETMLSVMEGTTGSFHFSQDELPSTEPTVLVAVDLADLLQEQAFRRTAWDAIHPVFPRGDVTLYVNASRLPSVPEHPLDGRIIDLAFEGQTIDEIALTLHATPFALYQRLFAMHRKGIVEPVEPSPMAADAEDVPVVETVEADEVPTVLGEATPVGEVVERALAFLREGKYGEAQMVASRAAEMAPDDPSAQTVLREAEAGLLADLRQQLLSRPLAPRVIATPDDLRRLRFTPAERYLLKRFDGKRPLSQVIRVSPIKELEALKLVRKFLEAGIVRLAEPA